MVGRRKAVVDGATEHNEGFFLILSEYVPKDIWVNILQFLQPYPYYFTLRCVSKQWLYEIDNTVIPGTTTLDLINRFTVPIPKNNMSVYTNISDEEIKYRPVADTAFMNRMGSIFKNITTIRVDQDSAIIKYHHFKQLENVFMIESPCEPLRGFDHVKILKQKSTSTVKSLTVVNCSVSSRTCSMLRCMVDPGREYEEWYRRRVTSPFELERIQLKHCISTNVNDANLNFIKTKLGDNLLIDMHDKNAMSAQESLEVYEAMKREGFHPNYIFKGTSKTILRNCIVGQKLNLFHCIWNELLEQARDPTKPQLLTPPKLRDILQITRPENYKFIVEVVDIMTKDDLPESIRLDITKAVKNTENHGYRRNYTYQITLAGYAAMNGYFDLATYFIKKGCPLYKPGTQNLLRLVFMHEARSFRSRLVTDYPELLTLGNKNGAIELDEQGQLKHEYNPIFSLNNVPDSSFDTVLKALVEAGCALHTPNEQGSTLLELVCMEKRNFRITSILEQCSDEFKQKNRQKIIELYFKRKVIQEHNYRQREHVFEKEFGKQWLTEARFGPQEDTIVHLVVNITFDCWGATEVQEYAIRRFGIKGNTQNKLGETPLNKFCTESNNTNYEREAAFNLISKHNCDPIHITNEGKSFLGSVAANFQVMFNAMIEQNLINVATARVEKNKNVFHYIFKKMYQKLVPLASKQEYWPLLIEPDTDGETPLMLMLKSRDANENFVAHQEEMIDHFMYEHVSPSDPVTPIMYMARNHCTSNNHYLFDYLLQNMEKMLLDKDTPKHNSQTILHHLASHAPQKLIENFVTTLQKTESEEDMAQYLNEKTADGKTAIVLLAEQGELAVIEYLLEQGATLSACEPINIVQVLSENNQHTQLLHVICDEKFKQVPVTLDLFVSAMKRFAIANASKQEQAVLNGFKQTLAAHATQRNRFFELLVRVPSEIDMENENYGESCSVIQLFCNIKKRQIVEWMFETFKDLLEAKDSPFDKHPLDMICEQEKQGENNILHFLCSNANLKTLFKEPIKIPAPNMTAAKAIHSILVNYGRAAELYTQFNKQGETPIHVACRSGIHTVWNDMIANGAQFDVETKNGDAPGDLVTGEKAVTAFQKSMNKFNKLKAPAAKKTKAKKETKRKRDDDDDEEEEERPVKRKVTRKSRK